MITATDLTLRAGARTLLESASFTIGREELARLMHVKGVGVAHVGVVVAGEGWLIGVGDR